MVIVLFKFNWQNLIKEIQIILIEFLNLENKYSKKFQFNLITNQEVNFKELKKMKKLFRSQYNKIIKIKCWINKIFYSKMVNYFFKKVKRYLILNIYMKYKDMFT